MKLLKYSPTSWVCSSCNALAKVLKEVDLGDIELVEVDVDKLNPPELQSLKLRGVPLLRLVDDSGNEVSRLQGPATKDKLQEWIRR